MAVTSADAQSSAQLKNALPACAAGNTDITVELGHSEGLVSRTGSVEGYLEAKLNALLLILDKCANQLCLLPEMRVLLGH